MSRRNELAITVITISAILTALNLSSARAKEYNPAFARASSQLIGGDYDDAINSFNEVIGSDPNNDLAFFRRGQAFYRLKNYKLALSDFTKAIKINPTNPTYLLHRGTTFANLGDDQNAIRDYEQAIKLNGKQAQAYFGQNLPRARRAQRQSLDSSEHGRVGRNQRAIQDYNKALSLVSPQGNLDAGEAAPAQTNSIEDLSKTIEANPKNAKALHARAEAYLVKHDPERAIQDYSEAIVLEPTNDFYYFKRAKAYQQIGQSDRALKDFGQAIYLNPLSQYYLGRANLYQQINKPVLADADIRRAKSVDAQVHKKSILAP